MAESLGRVGQPKVGNLIVFLLLGEAPYPTGTLINIEEGTDF